MAARSRATKTRAEERAESVKTPSRVELSERIEELERELADARARGEEHLYNWQRSAADFANFKRRTDEERAHRRPVQQRAADRQAARASSTTSIGPSRASRPTRHDPWVEGVKLVERKLRGVLESEGVTPIEAVGQPFDPNLHEAVVHEDTADHPDNDVIGEVQRGYRLHDRVIRPSLVRVANNPKEH